MSHHRSRKPLIALAVLVAAPLVAAPSLARSESEPAATPAPVATRTVEARDGHGATGQVYRSQVPDAARKNGPECLLERVETQLVRCDDHTGNGVPAPDFIPER